jgi:hypothetical protein
MSLDTQNNHSEDKESKDQSQKLQLPKLSFKNQKAKKARSEYHLFYKKVIRTLITFVSKIIQRTFGKTEIRVEL